MNRPRSIFCFDSPPGPTNIALTLEANQPFRRSKGPANAGRSKPKIAPVFLTLEEVPQPPSAIPSCERTNALRWLGCVLIREPTSKDRLFELGTALLLERSSLEEAAEILGVERTFEDGIEMWSIP